jgi:hypothetical protein
LIINDKRTNWDGKFNYLNESIGWESPNAMVDLSYWGRPIYARNNFSNIKVNDIKKRVQRILESNTKL